MEPSFSFPVYCTWTVLPSPAGGPPGPAHPDTSITPASRTPSMMMRLFLNRLLRIFSASVFYNFCVRLTRPILAKTHSLESACQRLSARVILNHCAFKGQTTRDDF